MRIALLHNTSAGSEDHTHEQLKRILEKAGHEVACVASRLDDLTQALQREACDLVVLAGGDGTVGRAACALAGWQMPLSIMPLGTANNTALALGLPRRAKRLAKSWHQASPVPFDLGLLDDGALRSRFSEAVGWGAFCETIAEAKLQPAEDGVRRTLRRDRKLFRRCVQRRPTRYYDVVADGQDYSGDYLMVEVMNVRYLGPRVELSPASDPSDGALELLLVGEAQRSALIAAVRSGHADPDLLRPIRAHRVCVTTDDAVLHRDGQLLRHAPGRREFCLTVTAGAVAYLRASPGKKRGSVVVLP